MVYALVRQGSYSLQDPLRKGGSDEAVGSVPKKSCEGLSTEGGIGIFLG